MSEHITIEEFLKSNYTESEYNLFWEMLKTAGAEPRNAFFWNYRPFFKLPLEDMPTYLNQTETIDHISFISIKSIIANWRLTIKK